MIKLFLYLQVPNVKNKYFCVSVKTTAKTAQSVGGNNIDIFICTYSFILCLFLRRKKYYNIFYSEHGVRPALSENCVDIIST